MTGVTKIEKYLKFGFLGPKNIYFDILEAYNLEFKLHVVMTGPCMNTSHDQCDQNCKTTPNLNSMAQKTYILIYWKPIFVFSFKPVQLAVMTI